MVAIGDMVSPADADYDFTLEKSIPGIRDLGCILISPDNESACIIANDKTYIYEFSSKSFIAQREFDDRYFRSGAWLEDGIILTTGPLLPPPIPAPPPITVLSPNDLSIKAQHSIESGSLFNAAASPDGRYLAGTDSRDLWIFDIKDGFSLVHHTHDHSQIIESIAWNNKGTCIASAGYEIWIFDLIQNTSRKLSITNANTRELFWSEDDSILVNLQKLGKLETIDVTTGELTKSESIAGWIVTGDILYKNNDICYGAGWDLVIFSLDAFEQVARFRNATDEIIDLKWIQDGSRIVTIADDGVLRIYIDRNHALYNKPPEIVILEPTEGQVVTNDFSARGLITDDGEIMFSLYRLNGLAWDLLVSPLDWEISISASSLVPGNNTLTVMASDGEWESTKSVTFYFDPDPRPNEPPTVNITSPENGSTVSNFFIVSGTAHDDNRVNEVFIRVDEGPWIIVLGTDEWSYNMNMPSVVDRWVQIQAKSFDGKLTSSIVQISVFIGTNGTPGNEIPRIVVDSPTEDDEVLHEVTCKGRTFDDGDTTATYYNIGSSGWMLLSSEQSWCITLSVVQFDLGSLDIQFLANDGELTSVIITVNITRIAYRAPTISILTPDPGQLFQDELNVSGVVVDGLWDIRRVEIRVDGGSWVLATGSRSWYPQSRS
jgi:hypothetical protein